jgi:hypothetical protein
MESRPRSASTGNDAILPRRKSLLRVLSSFFHASPTSDVNPSVDSTVLPSLDTTRSEINVITPPLTLRQSVSDGELIKPDLHRGRSSSPRSLPDSQVQFRGDSGHRATPSLRCSHDHTHRSLMDELPSRRFEECCPVATSERKWKNFLRRTREESRMTIFSRYPFSYRPTRVS